jgi:RTX calcium-binding nonapeptide repeat (4 copies)
MQIGTVGVPYDLAAARAFETIFSQMRDAGQTLFMPMSLHESHPVPKGTGLEAAFFPPPFGWADASVYDAMRGYGIRLVLPAELMYPVGSALPAPEHDPLRALIEAAGSDLVAAVYTYDEPVRNGVPRSSLKAVYEHVKAVSPGLTVIQVNAPAEAGQDIGGYLASVAAAAQWADQIGFSIYGSGLAGSGFVTPRSGGGIADPMTALADYVRWMDVVLPGKQTIGILQGFGLADLFSDELLATFDPALVRAAAAPDAVTMSGAARALGGVDTLMWFGASYLDSSLGAAWQDILRVSASLDTDARAGIGTLGDRDAAPNVVSEAAAAGTPVGLVLALDRDAGEPPALTVEDPRFAVMADGTVVLSGAGALDFETEAEVTLTAVASLADGRLATATFVVHVADAVDQLRGTDGAEELVGGDGADVILGLGGADWLWGQGGDDRIEGGEGADVLLGEAGNDRLLGDGGSDVLLGGPGSDRLTGGASDDMFVFRENEGRDTVTDFALGLDKVVLVGRAVPSLSHVDGTALVLFGGTEILLEGIHPSTLTMQDFLFLESLG